MENIISAQYNNEPLTNERDTIKVTLQGGKELYVPLDPLNRHYEEILKQVKTGTLTIKDAD